MNYSVYDPANGMIVKCLTVSNCEPNESFFISGHWDANQYYVKDGVAVELPPKPDNALLKYDFDFGNHCWIINDLISGIQVRAERTRLLGDVDRVTPVWYASLSLEQQQELADYRQALLAVPQQSGFPETVTWPVKPTWL